MAWDLTNELAAIHAEVAHILPDSCIIARLTETSDSQGGFTQAWAAVGTVDCRLVAKSGNQRSTAEQIATTGAYTLTVPHDTDIRESDRATIDSVVYRVLFVDDVKDWKTAIRCDVELETP